jgi:hypothetical protein
VKVRGFKASLGYSSETLLQKKTKRKERKERRESWGSRAEWGLGTSGWSLAPTHYGGPDGGGRVGTLVGIGSLGCQAGTGLYLALTYSTNG